MLSDPRREERSMARGCEGKLTTKALWNTLKDLWNTAMMVIAFVLLSAAFAQTRNGAPW